MELLVDEISSGDSSQSHRRDGRTRLIIDVLTLVAAVGAVVVSVVSMILTNNVAQDADSTSRDLGKLQGYAVQDAQLHELAKLQVRDGWSKFDSAHGTAWNPSNQRVPVVVTGAEVRTQYVDLPQVSNGEMSEFESKAVDTCRMEFWSAKDGAASQKSYSCKEPVVVEPADVLWFTVPISEDQSSWFCAK